jgi:hypothetical protein
MYEHACIGRPSVALASRAEAMAAARRLGVFALYPMQQDPTTGEWRAVRPETAARRERLRRLEAELKQSPAAPTTPTARETAPSVPFAGIVAACFAGIPLMVRQDPR